MIKGLATISLHNRGFTMIELLTVVGILVILTAFGSVIFTNIQKDSRDKQRIRDLKALEIALEAFRNKNRQYPLAAQGINCSFCINDISSSGSVCGGEKYHFRVQLVPYLDPLPHDPLYSDNDCGDYDKQYLYTPGEGGKQDSFKLWARMENAANANSLNTQVGGRPAQNYYVISGR